jgi:hypothetical protein
MEYGKEIYISSESSVKLSFPPAMKYISFNFFISHIVNIYLQRATDGGYCWRRF